MDFQIDIVGTCNLGCPSCPVGNMDGTGRPTGLMSLEMFRSIVRKIVDETPNPGVIFLYNWGEPFLHKDLPEFIKIVKETGLGCSLSTNLNKPELNLEAVLKAKPNGIRVSLSGYSQELYSLTHRRGDIDMVKSNLYRLRSLMNRLKSNTYVDVFYHQYLHNMGEEMQQME